MSDQCGIVWPLRHVEIRDVDNYVKIGPAGRKLMLTKKRGFCALLQRLLIILLSAAAGVCLIFGSGAAAQQQFWDTDNFPNGPCQTYDSCYATFTGLGDRALIV